MTLVSGGSSMADDVAADQFAVIRIEGMHCHRCEQRIQQALTSHAGVHEVEVDFASGQASVLFDRDSVSVKDLMDTINSAGYRATGFNLGQAGGASGQTGRATH
jgi:copper chaperone CopZ